MPSSVAEVTSVSENGDQIGFIDAEDNPRLDTQTVLFKANFALEVIQDDRAVAELPTKHELHRPQFAVCESAIAIERLAKVLDDEGRSFKPTATPIWTPIRN